MKRWDFLKSTGDTGPTNQGPTRGTMHIPVFNTSKLSKRVADLGGSVQARHTPLSVQSSNVQNSTVNVCWSYK